MTFGSHQETTDPAFDQLPWVYPTGVLPPFLERLACHAYVEKNLPIDSAIELGVSATRQWCGSVKAPDAPMPVGISPQIQAQACAAVAQWNSKKARHTDENGRPSDDTFVQWTTAEVEEILRAHVEAGIYRERLPAPDDNLLLSEEAIVALDAFIEG